MLPFMVLLLFGGVEATNYILLNQKVEKAGYVLTDITTQFQEQSANVPRPGELTQDVVTNDIFPQMTRILGDNADPSKQVVILTSLRREAGVQKIKWQTTGGGTLTTDVTSQVNGLAPSAINAGVKDTNANLPPDVATALNTMADGDNIVIGEVFVRYEPMASSIFPARTLKKRIYLHARNDASKLICLPPDFVYPECVGGPTYAPSTCTPTSICVGTDYVTRDCDGFVTSTVECATGAGCTGSAPTSQCEGNDWVTKDCKGRPTGLIPNDVSNNCPAICSATLNTCTSGTVGGINAGACGANATWTCTGAGGAVANCSQANGACPENGTCGSTIGTCVAGNPVNIVDNAACGVTATWECTGSNGGNNDSCTIAKPACGASCSLYNGRCTGGTQIASAIVDALVLPPADYCQQNNGTVPGNCCQVEYMGGGAGLESDLHLQSHCLPERQLSERHVL